MTTEKTTISQNESIAQLKKLFRSSGKMLKVIKRARKVMVKLPDEQRKGMEEILGTLGELNKAYQGFKLQREEIKQFLHDEAEKREV